MDTPPEGALKRIREDIDDIDDAMLALLAKRFAAVEKVREIKAASGAITQSPMRPAREAAILRRLLDAKAENVPGELRIRLWRAIISSSASPVAHPCQHGAFQFHRHAIGAARPFRSDASQ
jgi:chorismate mutase / prephenate dehydratase